MLQVSQRHRAAWAVLLTMAAVVSALVLQYQPETQPPRATEASVMEPSGSHDVRRAVQSAPLPHRGQTMDAAFRGDGANSVAAPPPTPRLFCRAVDGAVRLLASPLVRFQTPLTPRQLHCGNLSSWTVMEGHMGADDGGLIYRGCLMQIPTRPPCPQPTLLVALRMDRSREVLKAGRYSGRELGGLGAAMAPHILTYDASNQSVARRSKSLWNTHVPEVVLRDCMHVALQMPCVHAFQIDDTPVSCPTGRDGDKQLSKQEDLEGLGDGNVATGAVLPLGGASGAGLNFSLPVSPFAASRPLTCYECHVFRRYIPPEVPPNPPRSSRPLFAFLHRAEWRPSLLRDDLRLAVLNGPREHVLVGERDGDGQRYSGPVVLAIWGRHMELVPRALALTVVVEFFASGCTRVSSTPSRGDEHAAGDEGSSQRQLLGRYTAHWSSPVEEAAHFHPKQAEIIIDMGAGIDVLPHVGCRLTLHASALNATQAEEVLPHSQAAGAAWQRSRLVTVSNATVSAPIVLLATRVVLQWMSTPSSDASHGGCATRMELAVGEFCLSGLQAIAVPRTATTRPNVSSTDSGGGGYRTPAWSPELDGVIVALAVDPTVPSCVTIVDGHVSSFDAHGVASFPSLVLRRDPTKQCSSADDASVAIALTIPRGVSTPSGANTRAYRRLLGDATLRISVGNATLAATPSTSSKLHGVTPASPPPLHRNNSGAGGAILVNNTSQSEDHLRHRVLFAISAHLSPENLKDLLHNIALFAPHSVVVVHIAPSWTLPSGSVVDLVASWNGTAEGHPMIFVFNQQWDSSLLRLAQLQLRMAVFMDETYPWVSWTHVVLFASNERLVRPGIERYVQAFDLSTWRLPDPARSASIAVRHSFSTGRPSIAFVDPDQLRRHFDYWGKSFGYGGIRGEFSLAQMLRGATTSGVTGLAKLATHQVHTEGSFFRRGIAIRLSRVLDRYLNRSSTAPHHCLDNWVSMSEAFLYQVLQDSCITPVHTDDAQESPTPSTSSTLEDDAMPQDDARALMAALRTARCGERTGTVSWQNSGWYTTVEDVVQLRRSPLPTPFSLKRFPRLARRLTNNDALAYLRAIEANATAVVLLRDLGDA